jgi:imidazole glycerol-phosphate synthase subunit HisH
MSDKNKKIVIIDYELGNLLSLKRAIEFIGYNVVISNSTNVINNSEVIILPGVGSFERGMKNIRKNNLEKTIIKSAKNEKKILGICLGMQLFFNESEESTKKITGLNLIDGKILSIKNKLKNKHAKVPHIGWGTFNYINKKNKLFNKINEKDYTYFVHSYYASPKEKQNVLASTKYFTLTIPSVINSQNITGFQFHPEKSGSKGLELLKNYLYQKNA